MKAPRFWPAIFLVLVCYFCLLVSCASPPIQRPELAPDGVQVLTPSATSSSEAFRSPLPASTTPAISSPGDVSRPPDSACPPFSESRLQLDLNDKHQVMVNWQVDGGCPPYQGTLIAWYQDEFKPSAIYTITQATGFQLDSPILHLGSWDRDYYLTLTDAAGQRIDLARTIAVGR
jgi:hypothetical protein